MDKAFATWERGGVRFLAFCIAGNGGNINVVDEHGNNYGSWLSVERFRELQGRGDALAKPLAGCKVQLSGRVVYC